MSLNPDVRAIFEELKVKIDELLPLFVPTEIDMGGRGGKHYIYENGGKYQAINETAYKFLESYSQLTVEELGQKGFIVQSLVAGVEAYQNERLLIDGEPISNASFLGSAYTLESLVELYGKNQYVTDAIDRALDAASPFLGLNPDTMDFETLEPSSKIIESMREQILKAVQDKKLKELLGLSHTIAYSIEEGYGPDKLATDTADEVQKLINALEPIQITINTQDQAYEVNYVPDNIWFAGGTTTTVQKGNSLFTIEGEIEKGQIFLSIEQDYGVTKRINYQTLGVRTVADPEQGKYSITGISEDQVSFPDGVYDEAIPEGQAALDILRNDKSLEGKDIRTYQFQLYKELPSDGWMESVLNFFTDKPNTQELLKINFDTQYASFILAILQDARNDQGQLTASILRQKNNFFNNDFFRLMYSLISVDKELVRRVSVFNNLADAAAEADARGETLTLQDVRKIEQAGAQAYADSNIQEGEKDLTEEQIEDRQRFYKQCALLLNIHRLSPKFEEIVINRQGTKGKTDGPDKSKPFGGRFWRAKSENAEGLMTNLVSAKDSSYMFEIPPHIMTQLTPKLKLFKVMNDQEGKLKQTEFIFPGFTDLDRKKNFKPQQNTTQEGTIPNFLEAQFDKGDGLGLKSFSLDFNGTNPAEARNDVKGQMTLFFQSFADFTRKRVSNNGEEYRFVDLIIQPPPDKQKRSQGVIVTSLRQYEPTFYRIRVDMGYNIPKFEDLQGISSADYKKLKNALLTMNKSYYLCMIDHDFNIKNDGTVEMNFTYRAYLETALKSLRFDALTTPELALKRLENEDKLYNIANSKKCTKDELRDLQLSIAGSEEELILNSLNSIMTRMYSRGKIFNVTIDNEDRKFFLNKGFYKSCNLENQANLEEEDDESGDLGVVLDSSFLAEEPDVNFSRDKDDTNIQFFFFGDLLHTILDALFQPATQEVAIGLENTKIVLGNFEFNPYQGKDDRPDSYNISNIPISVDFFGEWFKDNVLNQKSTRRTFPVLNFIRNLSNHIVSNALLETCVNRNIDKSIRFQTGQISAISKTGDPLSAMTNLNNGIIDTDARRRGARIKSGDFSDAKDSKIRLASFERMSEKLRKDGYVGLPLQGDVEKSPNVEDFYHYIVLSCNGSALTYAGSGKYEEDIKAGRFHVEIGSNRGLVKTVSFSKTDMQYLREARFFRNGIDGLLQLSSVYTANVEMFGNTLFYPGMDLWINPYGFGGLHLGRPQQGDDGSGDYTSRSLANILGLGGYHTITSVSLNLTPGSFTTSIKSQHYYSGDGETPESTSAKTVKKSSENEFIEMGVLESASTRDAEFCETQMIKAVNFSLDDVNNPEEVPEEKIEEPAPEPSPAGESTTATATTTPISPPTTEE